MAFTFFFRDEHVLDHVVNHVIPFISGCSRPRIWDAGCAMGPEPYTLAIKFAENMGKFAFRNLKIMATDHDESGQFGEIIKKGEYPMDMLARIPVPIFERYFSPVDGNGGTHCIDQAIRDCVEYKRHDLLSLKSIGEGFSLVICKNVLLHFSPAQRVEVIRMFHQSLAPGGFFATEQTQKLPEEISHLFRQITADAQLFVKN
jgi:chemotaxis protein methyltransferase CheR